MSPHTCDVLIVGGGMVGLCLAHQLLERGITMRVTVFDKEPDLGVVSHHVDQQSSSSSRC